MLVFIRSLSLVHLTFVLDAVILLDPIGDVRKTRSEFKIEGELVGYREDDQRSWAQQALVKPADTPSSSYLLTLGWNPAVPNSDITEINLEYKYSCVRSQKVISRGHWFDAFFLLVHFLLPDTVVTFPCWGTQGAFNVPVLDFKQLCVKLGEEYVTLELRHDVSQVD